MSDTKQEIINLATHFILKKGYNAFSYADISKALGIKNAAIHYHFPTKEDLGVAVLEQNITQTKQLKAYLKSKKTTEMEQLQYIFKEYLKAVKEERICMIGSLGSDIASLPERLQLGLKEDFNILLEWFVEILEKGKKKGIFQFEGKIEVKATHIVNNLVAGALVARFMGKSYFEEVLEQTLADLQQ